MNDLTLEYMYHAHELFGDVYEVNNGQVTGISILEIFKEDKHNGK